MFGKLLFPHVSCNQKLQLFSNTITTQVLCHQKKFLSVFQREYRFPSLFTGPGYVPRISREKTKPRITRNHCFARLMSFFAFKSNKSADNRRKIPRITNFLLNSKGRGLSKRQIINPRITKAADNESRLYSNSFFRMH